MKFEKGDLVRIKNTDGLYYGKVGQYASVCFGGDHDIGIDILSHRQIATPENIEKVIVNPFNIGDLGGWRRLNPQTASDINKIYHNKEKKITVVLFKDGTKIKVKRSAGTKDDVYTAVAYAVCKKIYKSNSQFVKQVDKALVELK